ncbi:MAG: PfkB family carbohydrate kinase [Solirubrobacteraceae bacterium]|jgi:sugar/nucleoside kinase (ribokinase family)
MPDSPSPRPAARPEAVVAGHVSLDVFPTFHGPPAIEPGRLVVVGPASVSTGGVVANVGVALHRLGVPVSLIARVGDDMFGRAVLDALASHGAGLQDGIAVADAEPTSYSIVVAPPGEDRSFLHCPGANATFCAADVPADRLAGVRLFHFGYPPLMPRMYANGGAELRDLFARVSRGGTATSLDMCDPDPDSDAGRVDWTEVLGAVLPFVDVFAPSIGELELMIAGPGRRGSAAGRAGPVADHARLRELGLRLTAMGAAVAAIKLGDQGLYLRTASDPVRIGAFCERAGLRADDWRDRELLSPCFSPRAVRGTTGSGDATIAGLLAALLRGDDPAQAATGATAVGACSVEAVDPTSAIPDWTRVAARIAHGWPRLPTSVRVADGVTVAHDATGTMTLTAPPPR